MSTWITPDEETLRAHVSDVEIAAFRAAAVDEEKPDPIPMMIRSIVRHMRGFIDRGCRFLYDQNPPSTAPVDMIPDEGEHTFGALATIAMQNRPAASVIDPLGTRQDGKTAADRWLEWAAECPEDGAGTWNGATANSTLTPTFRPRGRRTL